MSVAAAVDDSVGAHLVADVPVGVLLSGGVDSTLIAACAAHRVDQIMTFSLVNPLTPGIDESSYARWNADLLGARSIAHARCPRSSEDFEDLLRVALELFVRMASERELHLAVGQHARDADARRLAARERVRR